MVIYSSLKVICCKSFSKISKLLLFVYLFVYFFVKKYSNFEAVKIYLKKTPYILITLDQAAPSLLSVATVEQLCKTALRILTHWSPSLMFL